MTLVNARAAFETAIKNAVTTADNTVTVVFDNMPFTIRPAKSFGRCFRSFTLRIGCEVAVYYAHKMTLLLSHY